MNTNKIIIGVTQFGMPYGIMNKFSFNRKKKLKQILNFSKKKKIQTLYTSKYYGDSNKLLGNENLNFFKIITKFKCNDLLKSDFKLELNNQKKNFKKNKMILMLDGFEKLDYKKSLKIYNILLNLKKDKYIIKFGYSIYNFKNLKKICKNFKPDILQCPFSVFDRRLEKGKLFQFLNNNKIEIHVRSIFLQGLLTVNPEKLPRKFFKWKKNFEKFNNHMSTYKVSNLSGCLNFVQNNKYVDKILIGVDNINQLEEILKVKTNKKIKFRNFDIKDEKLINPARW
ncbi:aldo/keto reductase [Candidatus Pelagibacter ubique]|nr:aldo/keto reductase [Candidatus Pelagibacter ubique]